MYKTKDPPGGSHLLISDISPKLTVTNEKAGMITDVTAIRPAAQLCSSVHRTDLGWTLYLLIPGN